MTLEALEQELRKDGIELQPAIGPTNLSWIFNPKKLKGQPSSGCVVLVPLPSDIDRNPLQCLQSGYVVRSFDRRFYIHFSIRVISIAIQRITVATGLGYQSPHFQEKKNTAAYLVEFVKSQPPIGVQPSSPIGVQSPSPGYVSLCHYAFVGK